MAGVRSASAHANLVRAEPAPESVLASIPGELRLQFDSALAPQGNAVALYHSDRSPVGLGPPRVALGKAPELHVSLPPLSPDTYTVAWTSVSAEDGDRLSQFYSFAVGSVPPATPGPAPIQLQVGDTRVMLRASRGNVGPNTLDFAVRDGAGKPIASLQRVIVRYAPVGLDLGQNEVIAPGSGGDARTPYFVLGLAGQWRLQIVVRRADADDATATTQLTLAAAVVTAPTTTALASLTAAPTAQPSGEPSPIASMASPPTPTGGTRAAGTTAGAAASSSGGSGLPAVGLVLGLVVLVGAGVVVIARRR